MLAAQEVLAGGAPRLLTYGITDDMAFGVGLPCGGEIDVFVEELARVRDGRTSADRRRGRGRRASGSTTRSSSRPRACAACSHVLELGDRTVFADVSAPPPRLFVYGAVDTAEALCRAAKLLGWRTVVADARASFATPERMPSADELLVAWPEEALAQVEPDLGTAIVVLTHDDKFDLPMIRGALASDAFYVGWIGSRRNQERRRGLLREDGVTEEELERISGPSGLDIGAGTPQRPRSRSSRRSSPRGRAATADACADADRKKSNALLLRRIALMLLREVEYAKPESVAKALELLAANDGARALAGGQTLINVMKARAASPDMLVDLTARRAQGNRARRRRDARRSAR